MIGPTFGSYEILGKLGEGGMGEVYRARDRRLNREIALKILPASARLDGERRERFQREAQAVAALNHPGIVTIYSVEEAEGTTFLTMELVEGRPLSLLIPKTGVPLGEVLRIGSDVADAVAAAHQRGITHRDLKPANIMIGHGDQSGRVKILDFGLAKLDDSSVRHGGQAELPTALQTGEGRILGTVAYMSPEQAEGKAVDARSDLFSLGVVLYEMATGRRPFTGDTSVSTISSIVKDTPPSVTELNPALPRELGRIIRRALAKDPDSRYQTAKDLRNDLRELRASVESGELGRESTTPLPAVTHGHAARLWQTIAVVAVLAAVTTSILLLRRSAPMAGPPAGPAAKVDITRLTSGVIASRPAMSPDGKFVAYVQTSPDDQDGVWVRQIATGSTVQIVAPEDGVKIYSLAVTPDGAFIDVLRWPRGGRAALWRVPLLGGTARRIVDAAESAPGWSPDGRQIAFLTRVPSGAERSVVVADADGSHARVVATRTLPLRYPTVGLQSRPDVHPVWMPDGRAVVVPATDERTGGLATFVKVDLASGAESPFSAMAPANLGDLGLSLALVPDGASVLANVAAAPDGPPQVVQFRLADGAATWLTADLAAYSGVSSAVDSAVTTRIEVRKRLWIGDAAAHDFKALGSEVVSDDQGDSLLAWAGPDHVVYAASLPAGSGVWSTDVTSGRSQLLLPGRAHRVVATADGRTILYDMERAAWRADSDGTHASRLPNVAGSSHVIVPDGSAVFYVSGQSGLQIAWKADLRGGGAGPFVEKQVRAEGLAVSPDGRWIAVQTNGPTNEHQTIILPTSGGAPVRHLPLSSSTGLQWTPDGQGLAYRDASLTNIWVQPLDGSPAHAFTHFTDQTIFAFGWSADGKRLALWRGTGSSDIVLLKGIR